MPLLKTLMTLLLLAVLADGQMFSPGRCPERQAMENFNISRYMCIWYGYKKYDNKQDLKCTRDTYRKTASGEFRFIIEGVTEANRTVEYRGKMFSKKCGDSKCTASFFVKLDGDSLPSDASATYNVMYTDYTRFSIIGHCENAPQRHAKTNPWHKQYLLIMVRSKNMTQELRVEIKKKMKELGMSKRGLELLRDGSCPRLTKRKENKGNRCPTEGQ